MCATNIVMKMKVGEKMKARNSWPFLAVWLLCFALLAGCALKPDPNVDLPKVSDAESDDMKEEDSELAVLRKNILDSELVKSIPVSQKRLLLWWKDRNYTPLYRLMKNGR